MKMRSDEKCHHEVVLLPVPVDFNLEMAVCNHGFFMMAPNRWIPSHKSLLRPLRLKNKSVVAVCITQPTSQTGFLYVYSQQPLSSDDRQHVQAQVSRMLRISETYDIAVKQFHTLLPQAHTMGFTRIFRSPNLFEDIVKSILLCYCPWSRSLQMAEALCNLSQKRKRKRSGANICVCCCWMSEEFQSMSSCCFPCPKDIARLKETKLKETCNLGYRAAIIIRVAKSIENGNLDLRDLESSRHSINIVSQRLRCIAGFGPFVVANITMCLGFYEDIPVDTETIKHLEQVHGKTGLSTSSKNDRLREVISEIYDRYAPFQCLAYWMEHVEYYEKILGKLCELPHSKYKYVATNKLTCSTIDNTIS